MPGGGRSQTTDLEFECYVSSAPSGLTAVGLILVALATLRDTMFPGFDRAYWLRNCQRFRVEASDGRLATVDDVGFGADSEPAVLIVGAGLFKRRVGHVPVDQIEAIVPEEEKIILHRSPRIFWQEA